MRLIDADKLLETYKKWIPQLLSKEDEGDRRGVETCIMVLEDMQTAVVRCRECKYRFKNNGHDKSGCPIIDANIWMDDDDFCSHGERKEGDDND